MAQFIKLPTGYGLSAIVNIDSIASVTRNIAGAKVTLTTCSEPGTNDVIDTTMHFDQVEALLAEANK